MSGPKVVRVVTREERVASCERWLERLDRAFKRWQRECEKHGWADADEINRFRPDMSRLRNIIASNHFNDLEAQVPRQMAFLKTDLEARCQKATAREAAVKGAKRRLLSAAATLRVSINTAKVDLPADLKLALSRVEEGSIADVAEAEAIIASGITHLAGQPEKMALTEQQKVLVASLKGDERVKSLATWLIEKRFDDDTLGVQIDLYIEELEYHAEASTLSNFRKQAAFIALEPSVARRKLLSDSLILDLAAETRRLSEIEQAIEELEQEQACVELIDLPEAIALCASIDAAIKNRSAEQIATVTAEAQTFLDDHQRRAAAEARRHAVLGALEELGYRVNEGMASAWVENGNVTVSQGDQSDYGLSLSGGGKGGPIQMRVAGNSAPGANRSAQVDLEAEESWCADFGRIKVAFRINGASIEIERASPSGVSPLVEADFSKERARMVDAISAPRERERK